MPRKTDRRKAQPSSPIVNFSLDNRTYQIDPDRKRVYRAFVEIETSRAVEIYSLWRSSAARA
jgi:hypothetical protein